MKRKINNRNGPELSYDRAVPLLGIYLEKTLIQKDIRPPRVIAAQFTIGESHLNDNEQMNAKSCAL